MRYLSLTDTDRKAMLAAIGAKSIDDLYVDVPAAAVLKTPLDLPDHTSEMAVERAFQSMAAKNISPGSVPSFLGAGAYRHHIPASADHLIQRGEFLTAYTPYQPEVSQGTLQMLFEFQTQVAMLTGMDVANASMYDGATATAEAVMMANRVTRRARAVMSGALHPHYRDVTETHAKFLGFEVVNGTPNPEKTEDIISLITDDTSCVVVQTPDVFGRLVDLRPIATAAEAKGALLIAVTTEAVAFGAVMSPGAMGADIVTAEGQSIGVPLSYGGPHVGLFATKQKYIRQMPGRVCGETVDAEGRRGWVLTLSTREQHIRREKATSNICTNSGLCALAFSIHLSLLGEDGLRAMARANHAGAVTLAKKLSAIKGVEVINDTFFNEFTLKLPYDAAGVVDALADRGILGGVPVSRMLPDHDDLTNLMLIAVTETNTASDMAAFEAALGEVL